MGACRHGGDGTPPYTPHGECSTFEVVFIKRLVCCFSHTNLFVLFSVIFSLTGLFVLFSAIFFSLVQDGFSHVEPTHLLLVRLGVLGRVKSTMLAVNYLDRDHGSRQTCITATTHRLTTNELVQSLECVNEVPIWDVAVLLNVVTRWDLCEIQEVIDVMHHCEK